MSRCLGARPLISFSVSDRALPLLKAIGADFLESLRAPQLYRLELARVGDWGSQVRFRRAFRTRTPRCRDDAPLRARLDGLVHKRGQPAASAQIALFLRRGVQGIAIVVLCRRERRRQERVFHELATVAQPAEQVEVIVRRREVPHNYGESTAVAEVQLIQRHFAEAARLFGLTAIQAPGSAGDFESTYKQATRLLKHLPLYPKRRRGS